MLRPVIPLSRRHLLGAAAGSLMLGRAAHADGQLLELSSRPENYEAPLEALGTRITPLSAFYIRSHFARPTVDPAAWRLTLDGLAGRPRTFSLADLARYPQTTVEAVLQCAGNGRALFRPRMPGVQWTRGAMGNATWTGVRLKVLLAESKPASAARFVTLRGADAPLLPATPAFVRSIPLDRALHEDTLIATHMNGAPLTPSHGAPARVVVPGWVGDDWVKWITRITLGAEEDPSFFTATAYRFPSPPGAPGEAIPPARMKPMSWMNTKSVITSPAHGAVVRPGKVEVVGVAFSGPAAIARVEVLSAGEAIEAALEGQPTRYGWRVFRAAVPVEAGRVAIGARATDGAGGTQPDEPVWNPSGYLHNAVHRVELEVRA